MGFTYIVIHGARSAHSPERRDQRSEAAPDREGRFRSGNVLIGEFIRLHLNPAIVLARF
jgi:hypothetical protein